MYNILNTLKSLEPTPEQTVKETARRIYESVEAQGSITAGVTSVEQTLSEKYMGFKKTAAAVAKNPKVRDPEAVAASIGRKKYGKDAFQKAAAKGKKMHESQGMSKGDDNYWEEIQDIMRKYGLSKQEALEYYYYERDDAKDWEDMERQDAEDNRGMAEDAKPDFLDLDHDGNEKESMKKAAKDNVRVHKGTYGTSYDPSDEEKKDKPKREIKHGQKGRPKAEKPLDSKAAPKGDIFGRTTGDVPKGKKGTRVKGKDMVDEVITKKTPAGDIIHDFMHSKNKKFAGKSKEQRKNQALGAYYGMHPEKSNESEMDEGVVDWAKEKYNTYQANRYAGKAASAVPGMGDNGQYDYNTRTANYNPADYQANMQKSADANDRAMAARYNRTGQLQADTVNQKYSPQQAQQVINRLKSKGLITHYNGVRLESVTESTKYKKQNFMFESFNFANMMKETDQTVQEMLTELQSDIANFKLTGECSPKLDAFLRVHGHSKKQLADEAKMPKVLDKIGSAVKTGWEKVSHPDDDAMLDKLYKDTLPPGASSAPDNAHDELDELAQLAGITDEGNAFTGKLAKTAHGDSFDLDGKTYKDTSQLDEETCNECGMYESQCSCTEGNLFTKKLAQTPKGGEFELDGKQYKDTSNLDETSMKLEDIARLAGIAVEGKDYGDTSFNEAPTYDNTPNEEVQGEDVLLKGGDGEVAGQEKKMAKDGAARFSDNPLAMKEAATFDPIEAMGRKLMKQYESIKLQK